MMDCAKGYTWNGFGAYGCGGAKGEAYMHYLTHKDGVLEQESCAKYKAKDGQCFKKSSCTYKEAEVDNFILMSGRGDGEEMKALGEFVSFMN